MKTKLYNGGSEWQNDYQPLPDYYQTYYRNYDPELGRFIGVDPVAESAESMATYQYAGNSPIMMNDPMGDLLPKLPPVPSVLPAPDWNAISQLQGNPLYNIGEAGPGGGPGGIFGAAYIGRSSDPNWASDGAFDTEGDPFSTDKGAAGRAFWAPAEASGGALDNATNPGWNISIYNAADNVAFNPVDVFTYNGKGIADLTFYGNVYSGYSISTGQGDHGLLINDGHDYNTAQLFSILENQASWPPGLSVTDISQGGDGTWSQIWNSYIARAIVPDVIGIHFSITPVMTVGIGYSYNVDVMTRGKDAGLHTSHTLSIRAGDEYAAGVSLVSGNYQYNVREATYNSIMGFGADLSGAAEFVNLGG